MLRYASQTFLKEKEKKGKKKEKESRLDGWLVGGCQGFW